MDSADRLWIERNYSVLLNFARLKYRWHGLGAVILEAPLLLDFGTMLIAGRVTYLPLTETMDDGDVYSAVREYDAQAEAVILVVTDAAIPITQVRLRQASLN